LPVFPAIFSLELLQAKMGSDLRYENPPADEVGAQAKEPALSQVRGEAKQSADPLQAVHGGRGNTAEVGSCHWSIVIC